MGIREVLARVVDAAPDEHAKGTALEKLVLVYLTQDTAMKAKYDAAWLWMDWPGRDGKPDTGIDLVARERDTGALTAIQCKFYAPNYTIQKSDIDSFFTASGKQTFSQRLILSTTDKWSKHAEAALHDQATPVRRWGLTELGDSSIDWESYDPTKPATLKQHARKSLRPHQTAAINDVMSGLAEADRGKLIMACGTGKTFTSLQIAERLAGAGGRVLFLVPSISLLQQTLREWSNEASLPLRSFAVCSDTKVGKHSEDMSVHDLMYPATTNPAKLAAAMKEHAHPEALTVVFSTYQSLPVVAEAQASGMPDFDLVICDEAHRTTGVTLVDTDESNFVRVHDNAYLKAAKRLYMTATPRIFDDSTKSAAQQADAVLCSMDDETLYGKELHRLGFGDAVGKGLLSDYKVLVLAVDEKYISKVFQSQLADENHELKLDDAAKIIGCWNGLAKRRQLQVDESGNPIEDPETPEDPSPMRRAVAFARSIKDSQRIADMFEEIVYQYTAFNRDPDLLSCEVEHVDGTFNVLERNNRLDWLQAETEPNNCRVLTNARCLSEGVDVPALDAVIFLNPRNSQVDVVQSVGRVMRKHADKQYGYVILPIGVPADMRPEEALADNAKYKVVWQVLNALRAHDDRFNAMVNKIELNRSANKMIEIIGIGDPEGDPDGSSTGVNTQLAIAFPKIDEWRDAIFAKIVQKVGDRRYWEDWAKDIAQIAERHVTRITAILDDPTTKAAGEFDGFLTGLRGNLNDSISRADAIDMLAQHLITKPVFDALFEGYSFAANNPVSQVMEKMLAALDEHSLDKEAETLDRFYESVRMRAAGIDNAAGKQRIITELYEKFFKAAFPKMSDKLGIVYTPIEVVDYIINSVQHVLQTEFGADLNDEGIHVLDPFTGTGTFMVRLLESGLITPDNLARKYRHELHANEIVLLAYYIAAINIEATYHALHGGDYEPFDGIVLTDTFQMFEEGDPDDMLIFPVNNERVLAQKRAPITVVLGNPPYSVGQGSQNDNNKNIEYPTLDERIARSYVAESQATSSRNLYDSYIRAFRYASDRVGDKGVIAFVTNGAWIDNSAMDGFRKALAHEFSSIWVFNLRGNQRTSGETSRKEGGKIFGSGSRTPVAITLLVKNPSLTEPAEIRYRDIGDYLTREEKLKIIADSGSTDTGEWSSIEPNAAGDWINQRDSSFSNFQALGQKGSDSERGVFGTYSLGVATARDLWVANSSSEALAHNVSSLVHFYNEQRMALTTFCATNGCDRTEEATERFVSSVSDPTKISWSRGLKADLRKDKAATVDLDHITASAYRPFFKQRLYFDRQLNDMVYQVPRLFPTRDHENIVISLNASDQRKPFGPLATDVVPNLALSDPSQCFPLYVYEPVDAAASTTAGADQGAFDLSAGSGGADDPDEVVIDGYRRRYAITDYTLDRYRNTYGSDLTKPDIFYFVYGLLHSRDYVSRFEADLRKMIPRIPLVKDFWSYSKVGRELADWHLGYESVEPWPLFGLPAADASPSTFRVEKMKFAKSGKVADKSTIIVNSHITLSGIPDEAYRYTVNGKSAIEWLIDRYQVKVDKDSQIKNDPNDYSDDPRYIVDLVARITRVSLESVRLIDSLPKLEIIE